MNFTLAKEIYGQPWFVDVITLHSLHASLEATKNGASNKVDQKLNQSYIFNLKDESVVLIDREWKLDDLRKDDKAIAIIKLNGPITKHGGMSHYGTLELADMMKKFDSDNRIVGHLLEVESGGGSAVAVAEMTEAIQSINKPVVVWADGIMASAAMYIASPANYIFAHRSTDKIGSVGTMIEFAGFPQKAEDKTSGLRYVRVYADQSVDKNNEFEAAINEFDFEPVKKNILNPHNAQFISDMKANRPNVLKEQLTGRIFDAKDVVGTLIDAIGTKQDAINKVLELSSESTGSNKNSNNQNSKQMTVQELKQENPDLYNTIIKSERDRVSAYLKFADIDLEACVQGIENGDEPSSKFFAEMTRKGMSNNELKAVEEESATDTKLDKEKEKQTVTKDSVEEQSFKDDVFKQAGLNKQEVDHE